MQSSWALPTRTGEADGRTGILRGIATGLRLRGHVECRIRPGYTGTRARRLGRALIRQRPVGAGDVSDLCVWQRRAEEHLAARDAERRKARVLRIDRTGFRIEPGRHENARSQSW